MKIELSTILALGLAKTFAKEIHYRVVQMHLRAAWGIHPGDVGECPHMPVLGGSFEEVQAAIRSIKDPRDRRGFIGMLQGYFLELRVDYVAKVKQDAASLRAANPLTPALSPLGRGEGEAIA